MTTDLAPTLLLAQIGRGLLGIAALLAIAWLFSEGRRRVSPRLVLGGLALQALIAALMLTLPTASGLFAAINQVVLALQRATAAGTGFVFGYLGGGPAPFDLTQPQYSFVLAFQALPLILVIGALSALLFHLGVLQWVVRGMAWVLHRSLGVGGPLGLGAAANVFIGMVEAPLLVKPWLERMSRAELFALMTTGMATIAGTVMVLYATFLAGVVPDAIGHLLTASLINAPAALVIAGVMVPASTPASAPAGASDADARLEPGYASAMDAITRGTLDAIPLLLNIIAMLVVFVALVSLANGLLGLLPAVGGTDLTLQRLLGWLFAPVVWLIGIPWQEAQTAGALMGTKTVLNELLAYVELGNLPPVALGERSRLLMTYALCGFANLGSLGILIGGLGTMAPGRRAEIVALGPRTIIAGTLATLLTAALAGIFL